MISHFPRCSDVLATLFLTEHETLSRHMPKRRIPTTNGWDFKSKYGDYRLESAPFSWIAQSPVWGVRNGPAFPAISGCLRRPFLADPETLSLSMQKRRILNNQGRHSQ